MSLDRTTFASVIATHIGLQTQGEDSNMDIQRELWHRQVSGGELRPVQQWNNINKEV
jgi:hypothetical protein